MLRGAVKDGSGAPLPSALVELTNTVSGFSMSTHTANDGSFVIAKFAPARYRFVVSLSSFETQTTDFEVTSAAVLDLSIRLEVAG